MKPLATIVKRNAINPITVDNSLVGYGFVDPRKVFLTLKNPRTLRYLKETNFFILQEHTQMTYKKESVGNIQGMFYKYERKERKYSCYKDN